MGIFKRMRDITLATVHDILDHVEDPAAMLNQYMRELEEEISKAELAVARQAAFEKKWENLVLECKQRIAKRTRQAQLAIDTGEEDIAREAILDKHQAEARLAEYTIIHETAKKHRIELGRQLQELKEKYYEMRNKKYALLARANAAQAAKQMCEAISSFDSTRSEKGFARMEERIAAMETEASVSKNLHGLFTPAALHCEDLDKLRKADEEIAALKERKQEQDRKLVNIETN